MNEKRDTNRRPFPATVVYRIGLFRPYFRVAINRGSMDGVTDGNRFVIYGEGSEIIDPETEQSLGILELYRGTAVAVHIQEQMTTLESDMYEEVSERRNIVASLDSTITKRQMPLHNVDIGDKARPI